MQYNNNDDNNDDYFNPFYTYWLPIIGVLAGFFVVIVLILFLCDSMLDKRDCYDMHYENESQIQERSYSIISGCKYKYNGVWMSQKEFEERYAK